MKYVGKSNNNFGTMKHIMHMPTTFVQEVLQGHLVFCLVIFEVKQLLYVSST